jgi:phage tail-like protein
MSEYKLRMWDGQREYFGDGQTGLLSAAEVAEYRSGNDPSTSPRKLPGRMKYDEITLERGLTQDSAFANWAAEVMGSASSPGSEVPPANFRKDIYVEFYNEAGQLVVSYRISGGWVTEHLTQRGLLLHNLQLHDGKTVREKLAEIFEASLSRTS